MDPEVLILRKFSLFDSANSTGGFFNEFSISKIKLFFQFKRIICHVPSPTKTRIKKMIKTENKNLCFKDQINFPKYKLQQTKITTQRQQNANTMQLPQIQNDGLL